MRSSLLRQYPKVEPMDIQIVTVFCLCDALLKAFNHQPDPQSRMSDAEVMTTALVATLFFGANFQTARDFLQTHGYIPNMLSKSRFNGRLHRTKPMFITLFEILSEILYNSTSRNPMP